MRRRVLIGLALPLVLVLGAGLYASWHYSSLILEPDYSGGPYDLEITAVDTDPGAGSVTLPAGESTERPGVYGLEWEGGTAVIGDLVDGGSDASDDTVTRELARVEGKPPAAGTDARIYSGYFQGDPRTARGFAFTELEVPGELGDYPAWRIDPEADRAAEEAPETWAILVHGINGDRREGLRISNGIRDAGLTQLLITYRDDVGAPASEDGLHHMGQTEWRDAEAAAQYALENGAERLVMVGFSMGGAVVTQFMENSPLAAEAEAMILDAPALDWQAIIAFNAEELGLPGWTAKPIEWMIGRRIDVDWDRLDALQHTDELAVPTLLFHGAEDRIIPIETSDEFAAALPETVTYHRVERAGHVQSWNVDPPRYERWVRRFLREQINP